MRIYLGDSTCFIAHDDCRRDKVLPPHVTTSWDVWGVSEESGVF